MRVLLVCHVPPGSRRGNRISAHRWARLLRRAGHRVQLVTAYRSQPADHLIALHARHGRKALVQFRTEHPARPSTLVLTGTDLYRDLATCPEALAALEAATQLVVLHPLGAEALPGTVRDRLRPRVRAIVQGARPIQRRVPPAGQARYFDVLVAGHLREEKDPLRTAAAARTQPAASRLRVLHAGEALDPALGEQARAEMRRNPRYRWLGNLPRWQVRQLMARCQLMVLSSRMEGGANVIGEAVQAGLPVLASRIHSSVGLLGEQYGGYFSVADTAALAQQLARAEADPPLLAEWREQLAQRAPLFDPHREQEAWARLIAEVTSHPAAH